MDTFRQYSVDKRVIKVKNIFIYTQLDLKLEACRAVYIKQKKKEVKLLKNVNWQGGLPVGY